MGAEHMQENRSRLEGALGRAASTVDLYLAHFLGAGGAVRFLSRMTAAPEQSASSLFPAAARANRSIFHHADGSARSLADVHALFARKLDQAAPHVPAGTAAVGDASGAAVAASSARAAAMARIAGLQMMAALLPDAASPARPASDGRFDGGPLEGGLMPGGIMSGSAHSGGHLPEAMLPKAVLAAAGPAQTAQMAGAAAARAAYLLLADLGA